MFDDKFVWGVASSAYQVEGTDPDDGRGKTVWDTFTEQGRIFQNQNAYTSCDHMHHYKDDYALMKNLGIKAYRFSLNWARILPEGTGRVNEKAIAMYRDMILTMKENGITPYITLFHWEFPQALQEKGGWLNEEVVDWFGEYAKVVAENFSDLCEYFITINEPQCVVGLGHLSGVHAPGLKLSIPETFQIAHNLLKAHGQAVINLRKYAKQKIRIGFAPTGGVAYPYTDSAEDIEAARKVYFGFYNPMDNWTWNISWFSDPVFLGHYPKEGLEKFKEYLPEITQTDMQLIHQPLDFMGQNIYNGYYVRQGADGEPEFVDREPGFPKTACNWPVTPKAFYYGIKFLTERYQLPLYITENGMSCHDNVSFDGRVHDNDRITFLDSYIGAMQRAYDEGVDIRGYFQWTFLDNFEWSEGYKERFGMIYVDFMTQRRIVKDSAFWYQDDEIAVLASERPVIQTALNVPFEEIKELQPGQALLISKEGKIRTSQINKPRENQACSFERIYFSRGSDVDIYKERKRLGEKLVPKILKAINNDIDHTVFSFIPNTAEVAFYGMLQGLDDYLNEEKVQQIAALGHNPNMEELEVILSRRIRSEKVAIKDIKLRTFIAEGNSRNDLAAHVYDITYGSLVPGVDNLVIIDDSIVRGTTLKQSIIGILDRLGPKKIVIVSSSPQVRYPDYYGIDMAKMSEFIAFRAAVELLKERDMKDVIAAAYRKSKEQVGLPKEQMVNYVKDIYAPFTDEEISAKMVELLTPKGTKAKVEIVYQPLEGLHEACPHHKGDWYFSGNYPTPGGVKMVNRAFIDYIEQMYQF